MNYASFWRRNIALLLDTIVLVGAFSLISTIVNLDITAESIMNQLLMLLYFVFLNASKYQATIGQMIMNIKIGDIARYRISVLQSLARYVIFSIPAIPFIFYMTTPGASDLMAIFEQMEGQSEEEAMILLESPETTALTMQLMTYFGAYTILSMIWFLPIAFTNEKTGIHDLITKQRAFHIQQ